MAERTPLVAANWKMHKTMEQAEAFLVEFLPRARELEGAEIVICPPFTALGTAVQHCLQSRVRVAAQTMHQEPEGAFTGEVSAPMLDELGVNAVVLGHSERRRLFGETDEALARKVPAALDTRLEPILCVGETEAEREAGDTGDVLRRQVSADLAGVDDSALSQVVIAYEPVWAIGTGQNATPEQAADAIALIRALIAERDTAAAESIRILYGGSVTPENAGELLGNTGIDGALVGGASLDPEGFAAIVATASR